MSKANTIMRLKKKIKELPDSPKVPRWKKALAALQPPKKKK